MADKINRIDEEIASDLKSLVDHFEGEDRTIREADIKRMRRLKLYWNNFSMIYWSETSHDYKIWGRETAGNDFDQDYYDKPVNIFRAFLETVIAALSIQIPAVHCVPDDADNPNDLVTAKAGDKIAELIYKHNDAIFLWLQAIYIHCTEGMIAAYIYEKSHKKYGTYKEPVYKDEEIESYVCPNCGVRVPDEVFSEYELQEFMPDDEDVELHLEIKNKGPVCLECAALLDPELQKTKLIIPKLIGEEIKPKSRACIEMYGGLYVKIANYAKKQEDTPYLIHSFETHYSNAMEQYYDRLKDKHPKGGWSNSGQAGNYYEVTGRLNTNYRGEIPLENVTIKYAWIRPSGFNILEDEKVRKYKKMFPDGVKVCMVNEIVADYHNDSLDDHWVLSRNPLSDHLNHDPLGELLTNIQDIVNDLISLVLQTIEHGIAQTYADPSVVDFQGQNQIEAMPGTLTPTKPTSGSRNIGEAFFTSKTAALSPEVFNFYRIIQELGQFVSGALPSIFGGQMGGGSSRTASEYAMSKNMALQRLSTPWRMMTILWKGIFAKAIPLYMTLVKEDERLVEKDKQGSFVNTFIRKAELSGNIGDIELEPDDKLPVSDEQKADMVMQLMNLNNQQIISALMDPENIPFIRNIIKIPQFRLPGEDDRIKQQEEISQLINEASIAEAPDEQTIQSAMASGQEVQPNWKSSIEVDPDVDNHGAEASICRSWLISEAGRLAKVENPEGYKNVLLHMKEHLAVIQQQMMSQVQSQLQSQLQTTQQALPGSSTSNRTPKPKQAETIKEDKDVRTPVE